MNVQVLQIRYPWGLRALLLGLDVVLSEDLEPSVHSIDLVLVLSLSVTFINVALGPLSEASSNLLDADHWVVLVVSHETLLIVETAIRWVLVVGSSVSWNHVWSELWVWVRAAVGEVVGIEVAADITIIGGEHSVGIVFELVFPARKQISTIFKWRPPSP